MSSDKKKIMIVDDNREFLDEMTEMLQLNGYEVFPFSIATRVVKDAGRIQPDIILLDLKMDKLSGFKIADELSKFPETSHIPVVAVTGFYTQKEHQLLMRVCSIKDCLMKPIDPERVVSVIEQIS